MQHSLHPMFETSERLILKRQEKQPLIILKVMQKTAEEEFNLKNVKLLALSKTR